MCGNKNLHMYQPNNRNYNGSYSPTKLRSRITAIAVFLLRSLYGHGFVCPPTNSPLSCNAPFGNGSESCRRKSVICLPARSSENSGEDARESPRNNSGQVNRTDSHLEEDIAKRLSISRDRAISALSQPKPGDDASSIPSKANVVGDDANTGTKAIDETSGKQDLLLPPDESGDKNFGPPAKHFRKQHPNSKRRKRPLPKDSFSSLLPPPIQEKGKNSKYEDDALANGLSSWEDFLGSGMRPTMETSPPPFSQTPSKINSIFPDPKTKGVREQNPSSSPSKSPKSNGKVHPNTEEKLPSITELFPPDFSSTLNRRTTASSGRLGASGVDRRSNYSSPALDGVLPVSDLFYRSAQSMNDDVDDSSVDFEEDKDTEEGDDEELPFSAEQSDQLTTDHNKIRIRRNQAKPQLRSKPPPRISSFKRKEKTPSGSRKMVRRGMEMLVGGVPINADPPQRSLDLIYRRDGSDKWYNAISFNSRDFGPMYHDSSVELLSPTERGLFCEHFVHSTMKWDVCPKDLKTLVKSYQAFGDREHSISRKKPFESDGASASSFDASKYIEENLVSPTDVDATEYPQKTVESPTKEDLMSVEIEEDGKIEKSAKTVSSGRGFAKPGKTKRAPSSSKKPRNKNSGANSSSSLLGGGEIVFSVSMTQEELRTGDSKLEGSILERVLSRGITIATNPDGFNVRFTNLEFSDMDDGTTMIHCWFQLEAQQKLPVNEMEKSAQKFNAALAQAMDDGDIHLAMAAAAKEELAWPESIRDRVVEEFLFEDDDGDEPFDDGNDVGAGSIGGMSKQLSSYANAQYGDTAKDSTVNSLKGLNGNPDDENEAPFGFPEGSTYHHDDIFLGGGNDGVFWDYSEASKLSSPYKGELGLRLVDAVVEREKARHPRVIAIGDVHGCIDELQDLLRQCDYRPGDLVVFLGDLVSKGPDSISVVKMAREIGAIGVRGNHDFEVIRWHQAIKSGVDPPVVGSEHFHIASCLSKADMKWMYSLPWYISSRELGALFVHAGFVSGIRLAKQNPRLMMNMRSILPDGTVTSKFFNNWPWARLWDGPQTVLFGHDADRGLQQYEHAIGLDTGCVYGGRLTACILPEKRLVSVSARREYFKYRRKHYD